MRELKLNRSVEVRKFPNRTPGRGARVEASGDHSNALRKTSHPERDARVEARL